jgi:F1F0 ATPase subunit 2
MPITPKRLQTPKTGKETPMTEIAPAQTLLLALVAGLALGGFYFGTLWWTLRKAMHSAQPLAWFLGGLLLRIGIVMPGFYLVANAHWARMLACLCGLLLARQLLMRLTTPANPTGQEAAHASES